MIKSIWIDNFKSLVDFKLELAKFNCIVGLNGAGKSTVLQALDFIAALMEGNVSAWLEMRDWNNTDLNSRLTRRSNIKFEIELDIRGKTLTWSGSFNRSTLSCTREKITRNKDILLLVEDGDYQFKGAEQKEILFDYEGSILSRLRDKKHTYSGRNSSIGEVKNLILNIRSLDLISPELLRSRSRTSDGKLGLGGEKLSAYIHESGDGVKDKLLSELSSVYPFLNGIKTKSLRAGWKQLQIEETFKNKKLISTARHTNDGMLRLMAILVQLEIGNAFLLFDEIENGINPELMEFLIDHLVHSDDQVLVTSHSPLVLNFLDDDVAKQGVIYLYKTAEGFTRSVRLFEIPSLSKKLDFMGPGEAFVDTDLTRLQEEAALLQSC